jgi:hypothetical protein
MDRKAPDPNDASKDAAPRAPEREADDAEAGRMKTEPPRTTTGPITAPKFGSAGSGGAELEPPTRKK